jgi:hypothetical protein
METDCIDRLLIALYLEDISKRRHDFRLDGDLANKVYIGLINVTYQLPPGNYRGGECRAMT